MLKSQLTPIQIAATDSLLSKGQKTFNSQTQQIEKLRARLAAWDTASTAYQEKYTRELTPLFTTAMELQVKLVHSLDRATEQKELTRTERRMLKELEYIDRDAIGRLDEERLRHYNTILKRQIAELKHELMRVESGFCAQVGISPFVSVKPETVMRELACDIVRVQQANREMERDLHALETVKGVKAKLRRRSPRDDFDGLSL